MPDHAVAPREPDGPPAGVFLVLPDGLSTRSFLTPRFIGALQAGGGVAIWHHLAPSQLESEQARFGPDVGWHELPVPDDRASARLLRQVTAFARIYADTDTAPAVMARTLPPTGRRARVQFELSRRLGRAASRGSRVRAALPRITERLTRRLDSVAACEELLRRHRPALVFSACQRSSWATAPVVAARKLGIPTAAFVASWDHVPKKRLTVIADDYLVWSDRTKRDLIDVLPFVPADRVHVVGTPQFEPHLDPGVHLDRERFLGAARARPVEARRVLLR